MLLRIRLGLADIGAFPAGRGKPLPYIVWMIHHRTPYLVGRGLAPSVFFDFFAWRKHTRRVRKGRLRWYCHFIVTFAET